MGTVLRDQTDSGARLEPLRLQVPRHAACLNECFAPGVITHLPLTQRLGQVDLVSPLNFVVLNMVKDQTVCGSCRIKVGGHQ